MCDTTCVVCLPVTSHYEKLDVQSVKWLEDYLIAHDNVTVLTVSHDSGYVVFCSEGEVALM